MTPGTVFLVEEKFFIWEHYQTKASPYLQQTFSLRVQTVAMLKKSLLSVKTPNTMTLTKFKL